jgi:putative (di)nucleoside polyphosphate hydrolase
MIETNAPSRTPGPQDGYRQGVGVMLLNPAALVLVARRIDMPSEAWQMPQGGIDPDEAPAEAALRELREEIGTDKAEILAEARGWLNYDLPAELRGVLWKGRFRGQTQKWYLARFTGTDADIDLETEHPEFLAWRWAPLDEVPDLIVPFKRQLYLDIVGEFRPAIGRFRQGGCAS